MSLPETPLFDPERKFSIHPTEVKGKFHNARVSVRALLVVFILGLPWMQLHGHQALLLDIVHRKFSILGYMFFAQDVPLLFLLVINFVLGVALTTALLGRVWCGWLCPQTVFIEGVFRRIEQWTEGRAEVRRKNEGVPLDFDRAMRKALKWVLFSMCTLLVTHSILAIFIGSDQLLGIITHSVSENPTAFMFIVISNIVLLVDFGWLREQFCLVACPYGKFQSVLQDQYTVSVTYHANRGEPRRGVVSEKPEGDCVSCNRCVNVCPTRIDIRNGSQLDCIACTACMDACNDVMDRLHKPKALIGYYSEAQVQGLKQKIIRPRIFIYAALIAFFGGAALYQIINMKPFEIMFYKTKGDPYRVIHPTPEEEKITNLFAAELSNKSGDPIQFTLQIKAGGDVKLVMPNNPLILEAGRVQSNPFTVEFERKFLHLGSADGLLELEARDLVTGQEWHKSERLHVIGPF